MNEEIEIWKDVVGYEGSYQVSNFGKVKSLERYVNHPFGGNKIIKERVLKCLLGSNGYFQVGLWKDGKSKKRQVHQLAAEAFLNHKPCGHKLVLNHKDLNKLNNHIDNLEIVTARENANQKHMKSSSQYVGVSWNKGAKKWVANIRIKGKQVRLGTFITPEEASKAYQKALLNLL